jgi:hypothetical protein
VWFQLLTAREQAKVEAIAKAEQLNLLPLAQDKKAVGEKVAQFTDGEVE